MNCILLQCLPGLFTFIMDVMLKVMKCCYKGCGILRPCCIGMSLVYVPFFLKKSFFGSFLLGGRGCPFINVKLLLVS